MNNQVLTKMSHSNEVRAYFEAVFNLKQSEEQFPVNLDEVFPLVYGRKDEAIRALKENFIQDVDYQVLRKNAEQTGRGGHNAITYKLSVSCMEYFIARKVRPVFEVYREVFHQAATPPRIPTTAEMLLSQAQLAGEQAKRIATLEERIQVIEDTVHPPTVIDLHERGYTSGQISYKLDMNIWDVWQQVGVYKHEKSKAAKQAPPAVNQLELDLPEPTQPYPAVNQLELDLPEPTQPYPAVNQLELDLPEPTQPYPAVNQLEYMYMTRREVATLFKISLVTVSDWTKKGILQGYKLGNRVYFKRMEVENAPVKKFVR